MTKVSVVIPVYNVEKWLPACLDSVLGQTLEDIEIICVDDHSPDRCPEILDEYAERDPRIKVIHLPVNSQQAYARNRGMEIAKGEFIYLLDSDDLITPKAMEELYRLATDDELDAVFFDSQVIYDNEELARKYTNYITLRQGVYPQEVCTGRELFDAFIRQQEWTCYIQRQFWRKSFLDRHQISFPEYHEHEDEVFPFKGILLAERVRYIPKQYFIRRYRNDSVVTSEPVGKNFYGYFRCWLEMNDFMNESGIRDEAAAINTARMYDRTVYIYDRRHDKEDLERFFKDEDGLRMYRLFVSARESQKFFQSIPEEIAEEIKAAERVYVYGAGAIARAVVVRMARHNLGLDGILVSDKQKNPPVLLGHRVYSLDEVTFEKNSLVVIALSPGYRDEVIPLLEKKNIRWIYYRKDRYLQ